MILHQSHFACDCVTYFTVQETDQNSLENSDLVFLGEVLKTGKDFVITVKEVFKGSLITDTLRGSQDNLRSNCVFYPSKTGLYLIYGNMSDQQILELNQCAATRSVDLTDHTYVVNMESGSESIIKHTRSWIDHLRMQK